MKEETIIGNKLIAEFLGETNNHWYINNDLHYHRLWDDLMPAVEKIESLGWHVNINKDCGIYDDNYKWSAQGKTFTKEGNSKIEAVWLAVVEFIKYYNSINKASNADTSI